MVISLEIYIKSTNFNLQGFKKQQFEFSVIPRQTDGIKIGNISLENCGLILEKTREIQHTQSNFQVNNKGSRKNNSTRI